jgi:hypothetical protein
MFTVEKIYLKELKSQGALGRPTGGQDKRSRPPPKGILKRSSEDNKSKVSCFRITNWISDQNKISSTVL